MNAIVKVLEWQAQLISDPLLLLILLDVSIVAVLLLCSALFKKAPSLSVGVVALIFLTSFGVRFLAG